MPLRNLLLISLDTLRFDALSAAPDRRLLGADAAVAQTPALDRVAAEGTFFTQAVTTCTMTSPSHAAIFTGTHWPKHGVLDLFRYPVRPDAEPLAEALQARGIQTAQNAGRGRRDGDMFDSDLTGLNRGYDFQAFGGWLQRGTWDWLRRAAGRPWFLFWHTMAVHRPYGKSHRVCRRLVRRDLAGGRPFEGLRHLCMKNVARTDRRFGKVWERLGREGLLDDTLVVILSDHGEGFSVHGTSHTNYGGWQRSVCRVPVILWAPGHVKAGQVVTEAISTVDVAPTIAELMGLDWEPAARFDGTGVADVVRGDAEPSTLAGRTCYFFGTMSLGPPPLMWGLVRGTEKYVSFAQTTPERWEKSRQSMASAAGSRRKQARHYNIRQLMARQERGELEFLYDTSADPHETTNLAAERPDRLEELRDTMKDWCERNYQEGLQAVGMTEAEERDVRRRLEQLGYLG